jgi:molecular chaperone GrpE
MNDFSDFFDSDEETMVPQQAAEEDKIENDCEDRLFRALAENENLIKRYKREVDNAHKFAINDFVSRIIPAKDSLEKGIDIAYLNESIDAESLFEGMNATLKIINDAFKFAGLEEINPIGKQFDPEYHEAMAMKKVDGAESNKVLSVYQKGYLLNGRLVRPARVEVSS